MTEEELSDLEWDIVSAIFGHRPQMDAANANPGTPPQRIDASAAHHIKDRVIAAIDPYGQASAAKTWDKGFTEGMRQWQMQREDPTHPITRTNPYVKDN